MAKKKSSRNVTLQTIADSVEDIRKRLIRLEKEENREVREEQAIAEKEDEQLDELEKLEELEKEIKQQVSPHPLARITYHDVTKGVVGAFFGIVGHFAFIYGTKLAHDISIARANALMFTSLVLLIIFIYYTGFRRIQKATFHYIPIRVFVIYLTAHLVILFVLTLFGKIDFSYGISEIYKNVAAVSILAVMGAATADLIGGDEH